MRKILINLFLIALIGFQLNCAKYTTADNSNQANANLPETAAETNQANANAVAVAEETPLPTFTSADEALSVGKTLLDDLEAEKAVEALRQAIKLNPDLADAHFNLGIAYALLEKVEEDNPPPVTEPTPTPVKVKKGKKEAIELSASEKSFENAVKAYKKNLAKNPEDDQAHYNLGRSYNKLNKDPEALKSLQQAVKLKPDDDEYQTELGVILIKLAQYQEAAAALKKAVAINSGNLQAESLLEKAEAGRRRVDFGNKPKPPQQQAQLEPPRRRENPKLATNSKLDAALPPPPPPSPRKNPVQ